MPDPEVEKILRDVVAEIKQITNSPVRTSTPREQLIAVTAAMLKLPIGEFGQIMGVAQNRTVIPTGVPEGYAKTPGEA
jgi:hypothetical protein